MEAMPHAAAPKNTQSEMPYTMRRVMANAARIDWRGKVTLVVPGRVGGVLAQAFVWTKTDYTWRAQIAASSPTKANVFAGPRLMCTVCPVCNDLKKLRGGKESMMTADGNQHPARVFLHSRHGQ